MQMLTFENKAAKVKLNDSVHKLSVDEVIEQIDKVYGMAAVDACYSFGEVTASADGAVDTLEIEIHSAGGSVFDGYRIYNSMRELSARGVKVTAKINTMAASMASVIAMAADRIQIASNGRIMIHDASAGQHGNAEQLRKTADMLDEISDDIAAIYAERTGKDKDDIRKMMLAETWIKASDAIEMGFADEIFDTKTKTMSILDKFKPDAALVEKVSGLETSLADAENQITEISAQLVEAQNDLANAISELTEAKNSYSTLTAEHDAASEALIKAQTERDALASEIEVVKSSAASKAAEILASAGVPALENVDNAGSELSIREQYNALKTPAERQSFREKNWNQLITQ
jgi:ATP-dependent protease ClpP protease subunit